MLNSLYCDKFREPLVAFKEGLNVVVGDSIASNSIGKSTILMIIDFVFGGSSYITANHDAIDALGQHEFRFSFKFDRIYYFIRNTKEYKKVYICDAEYKVTSEMKLDKFTEFLKEKYEIKIPNVNFRGVVGRYTRVYGKENLNEKKPLQYVEKETMKASLLALLKLFGKYQTIEDYEVQIRKLSDEKDALVKAIRNEFIPKVSKTIFNKNEKTRNELLKELEVIKKDIINASMDIEMLLTKDMLQLRTIRSQIASRKSQCETKLKRTVVNIAKERLKVDDELKKLIEIFPDINLERIKEIDKFHDTLTGILKNELQKSEKELNILIRTLSDDIEVIDKEIAEKLNIKNSPQYALDKIIAISTQISQLDNENSYYKRKNAIENDLGTAEEDLEKIKFAVFADISSNINSRMGDLNKRIYDDKKRAPSLSINGESYLFSTFGDTGTGTAYANLITFDLSLLELTCLPVLVHDLPLIKNIENEATANIIKIYNTFRKQIFIAIDKVDSYGAETESIIESNAFIKLSKENTLFILKWNDTKSV